MVAAAETTAAVEGTTGIIPYGGAGAEGIIIGGVNGPGVNGTGAGGDCWGIMVKLPVFFSMGHSGSPFEQKKKK